MESNVPAGETRLIKEMGVSVAVVYKLMLELYKKGHHAYPFWLNGWLSDYGFESRCNQIPCTHGWVVRKLNVPAAYGAAKCNRLNSPKTLEKMKCVRESTRSKETETS